AIVEDIILILKADYDPPHVEKVLFIIARARDASTALIGWAVIPWRGTENFNGQLIEVMAEPNNNGVIYILSVSSLAVYGVAVGAYASNNKYSFLGGLRAVAQMLSYEIPMGLIVLIMILCYRTPDAGLMVNLQAGWGWAGYWGIVQQP